MIRHEGAEESAYDDPSVSSTTVSATVAEGTDASSSVKMADDASSGDTCLPSILRRASKRPKYSVTFAQNIVQTIATSPLVWMGVNDYTTEEIVQSYINGCGKSKTIVQDIVVNQLREIRNNQDYSAVLNLSDLIIDTDGVQTLETVFKMVTFRSIHLGKYGCIMDLFEMLVFYDPTIELILSEFNKDESGIWRIFANAVAHSQVLLTVSFREMQIGDQSLRTIFDDGINRNPYLKKIRFDGCELSRAPAFVLANCLKKNEYLYELHICYLDLYSKEAEILGKFLSGNTSLKILDLSNNRIGDHGFEVLSNGLLSQAENNAGVEVLMLFNNQLTYKCGDTLNAILSNCPLIHTINVGLNNLTDIAINAMQQSIENSSTLRALGLQSTLLTCSGLNVLTEVCEKNSSLWHLNLRGNKAIQPEALTKLADIIHKTTLVQIDLDDTNRSCGQPQKHVEIVNKIRHVVAINKTKTETEHLEEYGQWRQELFLNCDSVYVPKSIPHGPFTRTQSQAQASNFRTRFSVVKVSESAIAARSSTSHRFTVVQVASVCANASEETKLESLIPELTTVESQVVTKSNEAGGGDNSTGSTKSEDLKMTKSVYSQGSGDAIIFEEAVNVHPAPGPVVEQNIDFQQPKAVHEIEEVQPMYTTSEDQLVIENTVPEESGNVLKSVETTFSSQDCRVKSENVVYIINQPPINADSNIDETIVNLNSSLLENNELEKKVTLDDALESSSSESLDIMDVEN